jgi:lambda family phage portal protein
MGWLTRVRAAFGLNATRASAYEVAGSGRRALAWAPGNPGVNAAIFASGDALRSRSRDLVRRNPWAANAIEAFVANCIGTGIKPRSMAGDEDFREAVHALWWDWSDEADAAGLTDLYGLQALACRAMMEGGECFVRLRFRRPEDGLSVPLQLQVLEAEHVPLALNMTLGSGNVVRAGIEFDHLGRRVAYHMYREHPGDPAARAGGHEIVRVPAEQVVHLFRPLRPGQVRGEPWLARALVKLHELDQYDDAELVRKKTAAMFAGFITRLAPEDAIMGEGEPDEDGAAIAGLEPGTMQVLAPGEDVKFSDPADVGGTYGEFLRNQFRAVAVAAGVTYEQLTGDLTGVNYSSIRAGLLEFRRRCEMIQYAVVVHQLCRPVWRAWMRQAVLAGALRAPGFEREPARYLMVKWVPQGWQWIDPEKEFKAVVLAIRAGLMSRAEAVAELGYDIETIDREIAADNARADALDLVFDSDPRRVARTGAAQPDTEPFETRQESDAA